MISTIDLDTPHGVLHVTWSAPRRVYFDAADDVGLPDPLAVQEPPFATLNGVEITIDRAKEILEEMRGNAPRS